MSLLDDNFEQNFTKDLIINSVSYFYNAGSCAKYVCDKFYIYDGDQVLDSSSDIDWLDIEANSHEWFSYFNYHTDPQNPKKPESSVSLMISKKSCASNYINQKDRRVKGILWYGGFENLKYIIERYLYSLNKI